MALNFDNLRKTGVYTFYDKLVLTEAGAVVNMENAEGAKGIYQWNLTGTFPTDGAMVKGRSWNVTSGTWGEWKEVGNPPVPPQPVPGGNPGTDPGDGMWDECDFRVTTQRGMGTETLGYSKGTGTVMVKPAYPVYDRYDAWTNRNPDPLTIKTVYLTYDFLSSRYMWKNVQQTDIRQNISFVPFRDYVAGDWLLPAITVLTQAPPNTRPGDWVRISTSVTVNLASGGTKTLPQGMIVFLYNAEAKIKYMRNMDALASMSQNTRIRNNSVAVDLSIPIDDL